ncbi:hypothetical protein OAN47_00645 [Planctomycetota bacterium]|nr:hypothetical protein [Planctomycetota bacterium]
MRKTTLSILSILSIVIGHALWGGTEVWAADRIAVSSTAAAQGSDVTLAVTIENDVPIVAFSFGLLHDAGSMTPTLIEYAGPVAPDFIATSSDSAGHSIGVVLDYELANLIPAGGARLAAIAHYAVLPSAPSGSFSDVTPGTIGSPPIDPEFSDGFGNAITPLVESGGVGVLGPLPTDNPATLGNLLRTVRHEIGGSSFFETYLPGTGLLDSSVTLSNGAPIDLMGDLLGQTWILLGGDDPALAHIDAQGSLVGETATGADPIAIMGLAGNRIGVTHADGTVQIIYPDGTVLFGGDGVGDSSEDGLIGPAQVLPGAGAFSHFAPGPGNSSWLAGGERLIRLLPNGNVVTDRGTGPGQTILDLAQGRGGSIFVLTPTRLEHRATDGSVIASTDLLAARLPLALATIPKNIAGDEETLIAVLASGTAASSLLTVFTTSTSAIDLVSDDALPVTADLNSQLTLVSAGINAPTVVVSGTDANNDLVIAAVGTSGIEWSLGYPGAGSDALLSNAASSGIPTATFLRDPDFDGDGYSNNDELLVGSSPFDTLEDPTDVVADYVPPMATLNASLIDDINGNEVQDCLLVWTWSSPTTNNPDTFEITRITDGVVGNTVSVPGAERSWIDLDPPPGTHVYVGVAVQTGGVSDVLETSLVIGTGEVEQEVPIDVPFEFTEIYDITSRPDAELGGVRYYVTDAANGQVYGLDEDFNPLAVIPSPFGEGVPCTGIAYVPSGDAGNGSLVIGNGQSGVQIHLIEITLTGEFLRDYFLFVPVPFGSKALLPGAVEGSTGGMGYDEGSGSVFSTDVTNCEILGMAHGGSGAIDPSKSFTHPNEGSSQKGCTTKACQLANGGFVGCVSNLYLTSSKPDGTLEIIEVSVNDGEATQVGEGISLAGIEDPGGIVFEGDSFTITGNSDGSVYQVQSTGTFIRADANEDFMVDIGDTITTLGYLFTNGTGPECLARMDVNDDDMIDIGDAIYLLNALFVSGSADPPPPFGSFLDLVPGPDPTPSAVTPCP